jgi:type II secretory pathway component GspD/PulD (secretin)
VFHDIGIDWSMLDGMKGAVSLAGGIQKNRLGKGVQDYSRKMPDGTSYSLSGSSLVGGADGDIAYFNGTLDFSQMYIVLSALEGSEDARIFSNPKIIVSSGKKATVDMTTKYPNIKIAAKRTTNSGGDSLDLDMQMAAIPGEDKMMFANEAFFSWGISLDVTPRIGTNGLISVSIVPTISSQNGWVESGTESADSDSGTISARYPVIEVQRLVTEFAMASGTTAVIGGLSRTVEEQVDTGIPLLRDIPWIGPRIFGSRTRKKQQKEIIVFVTVGLVDPGNMQKDSGLPKNAVLGRQYTKGQKLEPGDRPEKNLEGISSLDLRSLEEQAEDPLPPPRSETSSWIPFVKDPNYKKEK